MEENEIEDGVEFPGWKPSNLPYSGTFGELLLLYSLHIVLGNKAQLLRVRKHGPEVRYCTLIYLFTARAIRLLMPDTKDKVSTCLKTDRDVDWPRA